MADKKLLRTGIKRNRKRQRDHPMGVIKEKY